MNRFQIREFAFKAPDTDKNGLDSIGVCYTERDPNPLHQNEHGTMYACYVKFTAQPGQRDALVEHLLKAAKSVESLAECQVYLINTSATQADVVWVTEVWQTEAAHDTSLTGEETRAAIQQVLPLLADRPEKIDLVAVGGKGIAAE